MRRFAIVVVLAFLALGSTTAWASWEPGGPGSGNASARALGVPTAVAASATSSPAVEVTWAGPGGVSVTPAQYVVRRTAPTATTVCTVNAAVHSCDDTALAPGTVSTYIVEATVGAAWVAAAAPARATTPGVGTFAVSVGDGSTTAGSTSTVTLTATTNGTTVDTGYSGWKVIGFSGPSPSPSGTAPSYPTRVHFSSGVANASVTASGTGMSSIDCTVRKN